MESLADKLRRADGSAELEALRAENEALRARLAESEAAVAAMRHELVNVVGACPSEEVTDQSFWSLIVQIRNLLSSTDAGKPLLEMVEAAKRLREFVVMGDLGDAADAAATDFDAKLKAAGL